MHVGKPLLIKENGQIKKGIVINFSSEDLEIKLEDGNIVRRKFWEIREIPHEKTEE